MSRTWLVLFAGAAMIDVQKGDFEAQGPARVNPDSVIGIVKKRDSRHPLTIFAVLTEEFKSHGEFF